MTEAEFLSNYVQDGFRGRYPKPLDCLLLDEVNPSYYNTLIDMKHFATQHESSPKIIKYEDELYRFLKILKDILYDLGDEEVLKLNI